MAKPTILIAAGGTGGHVFPALAVASVLRDRDVPVVWVGSESGMENRIVPKNGIPIRKIGVSPLRGGGVIKKIRGLRNLVVAISSSIKIVRQEKAETVLGMGGYVSGPVCVAAKMTGCRMLVHEQNAVPGFTNRLLKRIANKVLEAMPNTFKSGKNITCTGNPVRQDLLSIEAPQTRYANRNGALRVLIIGGSQGALALNRKVPDAVGLVDTPLDIIHQCGGRWLSETKELYKNVSHDVRVHEFIEDMASVYSWADIVICRAGAMTVAELAAVGVASLLVPYPAAVDDHQTANGAFLVEAGAAEMIKESELSAERLATYIQNTSRQACSEMACNAREVSVRDATDKVVAELMGVAA